MYYLSLLAIFKNEEDSLALWMDHYCWMGVDHFYLIDNGSTDNSLKVLQPYQEKGIATIFSLPEKHKQQEHYQYVYDKAIKNNSEWVIVADLDEFWYVKDSTIKDRLKQFGQYQVIQSKWRMFGSNGLLQQPKDIRVSITHRHASLHPNTKCIFQTKQIMGSQITLHTIEDEPNQTDASHVFRLNHYPIQSWEYFQKVKMKRGDATSSTVDNIRDEKYFKNYDKDTDFEDVDLQQMVMSHEKNQKHISNACVYVVILFLFLSLLFCLWLFRRQTQSKKNRR
jgi:hypothetical protein